MHQLNKQIYVLHAGPPCLHSPWGSTGSSSCPFTETFRKSFNCPDKRLFWMTSSQESISSQHFRVRRQQQQRDLHRLDADFSRVRIFRNGDEKVENLKIFKITFSGNLFETPSVKIIRSIKSDATVAKKFPKLRNFVRMGEKVSWVKVRRSSKCCCRRCRCCRCRWRCYCRKFCRCFSS